MARGRIIAKAISLSRKVNRLSIKMALIYTWAFSHADDWGLLSNDPSVIKATVFPMKKQIKKEDIQEFLVECQKKDESEESLITTYQDCIFFNAFYDHQTISPEKRAKSRFSQIPRVPQESPGKSGESQEIPVQDKVIESKVIKSNKKEHKVQEVVNYFFEIKGWATKDNPDSKQEVIFSRYVRPAKDLLFLCDDNVEEAKICIQKVGEWAKSRDLDWGLETIFKKWYELDFLKPKEKKPYWDNCRIFQKSQNGKWWIIRDGEIKELGRDLYPADITWK